MTVWHILTDTDDAVGRTLSLFVGIFIGYTMACVRKTMIYAKLVKREVHEIHEELRRLDAKITQHHPNGDDDGEVPG